MAFNQSLRRYRHWYGMLLRLYPKPYYDRFGESMKQTFSDMCREPSPAVFWIFAETFTGILRTNLSSFFMNTKHIIAIALGTGLLLLIPLIAMQYSADVVWTLSDFIFAGTLLFGTGVAIDFMLTRAINIVYKAAAALAALSMFLMIWVNAAVGLIGGDGEPVNAIFLSVPVVALVGAMLSKLSAVGMMRTMFAAAIVQILLPIIAYTFLQPAVSDMGAAADTLKAFGVTGFFAVLFMTSSLLFQRARQQKAEQVS